MARISPEAALMVNNPGIAMRIILVVCMSAAATRADSDATTANAYRDHALEHQGDAAKGQRLFETQEKLACSQCHRITGMEKCGPNLDGIGDKYTRADLIQQVLEPSATIKPGYEQAIVVTRDGRTLEGRLERSTKLEARLLDAQGKQFNLSMDEIEQLTYATKSLMPENVAMTVSKDEFADLIAYLETLGFGVKQGMGPGGREVAIPRLASPIHFVPIHPDDVTFSNPVACMAIPGVADQLVVVEHQEARIWRYVRDARHPRKEVFVDLSGVVHISGNQGVMCIAFHPDYQANGRYFLEYEVKENDKVLTTVVERRASMDRLRDAGGESIRLLEVEQPAYNHNGGCIAFGPDGMLYAAFGDGGPQRDPPGYSQNPRILLGSMLRIDVDRRDERHAYAIPADNPFLRDHEIDPTIRPETWAIGFREPWRFSFDSLTGDLYVGDVGQDTFEEVCLVHGGENHGWNVREAFAPFSDEYRRDGERYADPLFAYRHGLGFSVTGGHVYRADDTSSFYGVYIFGDYNTRRVWGLRQRDGVLLDVRELGTAPGGIASFGLDDRGELLLVTYGGRLFHLDLSATTYPMR